MKTVSFALFFSLFYFSGNAQTGKNNIDTSEDRSIDEKIFSRVEVDAEFPGGDGAWATYLQKNLDANVPVRKKAKRGRYMVVIHFIVDKEGEIRDVQPETSFGHGMEEEVMRIITSGPKWTPAVQNGRKVNSYRRQPVTFVVQ